MAFLSARFPRIPLLRGWVNLPTFSPSRCAVLRSRIELCKARESTTPSSLPETEREKMASRTTASGGDYNLSDPVNSFVDVVRRVMFEPTPFFAGLPRQGNLLNPLVFALICIEISVILVGLLTFIDVPGGINWLWGARDRKSTRLNSSHANISYAVFCLKKKRTL